METDFLPQKMINSKSKVEPGQHYTPCFLFVCLFVCIIFIALFHIIILKQAKIYVFVFTFFLDRTCWDLGGSAFVIHHVTKCKHFLVLITAA